VPLGLSDAREARVLGNGTLLASVSVNHGTSEVIERWFRNHPLFGADIGDTPSPPPAPGAGTVADELKILAELRSEGVLTDEKFEAQKNRLFAG
jgi:hypothetical protein